MAGRERKYDDDAHRKLRERVARHRRQHKARLALEAQQRSLAAGRQQTGRKALWRVYERTVPLGDAGDVLLTKDERAPDGYGVNQWLPTMTVSWRLACELRQARLRQIRGWGL
jgi:hypothetical protein